MSQDRWYRVMWGDGRVEDLHLPSVEAVVSHVWQQGQAITCQGALVIDDMVTGGSAVISYGHFAQPLEELWRIVAQLLEMGRSVAEQ